MPTTELFKQRAASFLSHTSGPSVTRMLAASVGTSVLALIAAVTQACKHNCRRAPTRWQRSFAFDFSLGRALGVWQY
jgi:hypothetical protein